MDKRIYENYNNNGLEFCPFNNNNSCLKDRCQCYSVETEKKYGRVKTVETCERVGETYKTISEEKTKTTTYANAGSWREYKDLLFCTECGFGLNTATIVWAECDRASDERMFGICVGGVIGDLIRYCPQCGREITDVKRYAVRNPDKEVEERIENSYLEEIRATQGNK